MPAAAADTRVRLPGLHPSAFEHPLDRTALQALRKTPGLDILLKKVSAISVERAIRLRRTSSSLRLSPRQLPQVYDLLRESCDVLDVAEPELYLHQEPRA